MYPRILKWSLLLNFPLGSASAFGHSRWFLTGEQIPPAPPLVFDKIHAAMFVLILLFVAGGLSLTRRGRSDANLAGWLCNEIHVPAHLAWRALSIGFGTALVINTLLRVFVAPDLIFRQGLLFQSIAFIQIIVGSMFILQSRLYIACGLTVLLPVGCWSLYSFGHAMDYAFELFGIGIALFLMAPILSIVDRDLREKILRHGPLGMQLSLSTPVRSFSFRWRTSKPLGGTVLDPAWVERRNRLATTVLRVMLGLQLIVLAAHDKLLDPSASLAFVDKFDFVNVPALLGASSFTNLHFVIGAGLAEIAFGAMLMGNIATRPVCALLILIFVITGYLFGVDELVGHVPIVAALVVVLVSGSVEEDATAASGSVDVGMFRMASGACAALVLGAFLLNAPAPAVSSAAINVSTVPGALYKRFLQAGPGRLTARRELARADDSVRSAIAAAERGQEIDKDDLARRMFELSARYEAEYGADAAGYWIRYAYLTAVCSHDDLLSYRALVGNKTWSEVLQRAPAPLVAELSPIAHRAAEAILKRRIAVADASIWRAAADAAPTSGATDVHTHTLAAISRIIANAATDTKVWIRPSTVTTDDDLTSQQ